MTIGLNTTDEYFMGIFDLQVGDSFKFDNTVDYETVFKRIAELKPQRFKMFDVMYAQPGTSYYVEQGPNTIVIIKIEMA